MCLKVPEVAKPKSVGDPEELVGAPSVEAIVNPSQVNKQYYLNLYMYKLLHLIFIIQAAEPKVAKSLIGQRKPAAKKTGVW